VPGVSRRPPLDPAALFAPLHDFKRIALAVSGGPDSLALMLLAYDYARLTGDLKRFVVYSVDHGLRPEAADEVAFVLKQAKRLGFAARGLKWAGKKPKTGIQEAARTARYGLLSEAMRKDGAQVLVTAHHLGDQAETVLMRLAHGSGIEGLRGIDMFAEIGDLMIVRPLLTTHPDTLRALVKRAGLTPVSDPSNEDASYERVRWRQMLPQLAALGLTPERLEKFAIRMRDADRALSAAAGQVATGFEPATRERSIARDVLRRLPRAVAVKVIGRLLSEVGGGRKPYELAAVEALTDRLIREPVRTTLHGCLVRSDKSTIRILAEPGREAARNRRREPTGA
jgi:tRNA(Ile)-lysidine synthase